MLSRSHSGVSLLLSIKQNCQVIIISPLIRLLITIFFVHYTVDDSRSSQLAKILKIFIISNLILDTVHGWHFVRNIHSVD